MGKEELISKVTTKCWEHPSPHYFRWVFCLFVCFSCRGLPPKSGLLERGNLNQPCNKRQGEKAGEMSPSLCSSCRHPGTAARRGKERRGELSKEQGRRVPAGEGSGDTDIPSRVPGPGTGRCPVQKGVFHGWCIRHTRRAGRTE